MKKLVILILTIGIIGCEKPMQNQTNKYISDNWESNFLSDNDGIGLACWIEDHALDIFLIEEKENWRDLGETEIGIFRAHARHSAYRYSSSGPNQFIVKKQQSSYLILKIDAKEMRGTKTSETSLGTSYRKVRINRETLEYEIQYGKPGSWNWVSVSNCKIVNNVELAAAKRELADNAAQEKNILFEENKLLEAEQKNKNQL